jgi:hypothetical protein
LNQGFAVKRLFRDGWILMVTAVVLTGIGCGGGTKPLERTPPAEEKPPEVEMPKLPPA